MENHCARGQLLGGHRQLASLPQTPRRLVGKPLLPGPRTQFHVLILPNTATYGYIYGGSCLKPGASVVEYAGGSTGVSLSLVCAVKKYPLHIVTSDAFSKEKLDHMQILGATLQVIRSEGGGMTEKLMRDMIATAGVVAKNTGAFWTDQMKNRDQLAVYHRMADEI
jgi:Pyridoxal-phosphate dependent enzyme